MKIESADAKKLFSVGGSDSILTKSSRIRATASATIEPAGEPATGARSKRDHVIKVQVELNQADTKHVDKAELITTARRALAAWAPGAGEPERLEIREVSTARRSKTGAISHVVIAIEGSVVSPGRPTVSAVEALSASLLGDGYRVVVRERRECLQAGCATDAMVPWNQLEEVPMGWCTTLVCGRHCYKSCTSCQSVYLCTSVNAAGQAPSVRCSVCEAVLIEWGSSKVWEAELVTRGDGAVGARSRTRRR